LVRIGPALKEQDMPKRVVRHKEAQKRLACGHTKYFEDFVARLEVVELGRRSGGVTEESLDRLITELIRERPTKSPEADNSDQRSDGE
jgi:hypothetical protein